MTKIPLKGLASAVLLSGVLGFGLAMAADHLAPIKTARLIKVSAQRYVFVPDKLELKVGEPVDIELSTLDVVMGFKAPDFSVRESIVPGQVSHVRFTPTKVGTYSFLCDVFCGSGHEDMNGTIVVVE